MRPSNGWLLKCLLRCRSLNLNIYLGIDIKVTLSPLDLLVA
jgi:hypothetical protein